MTFHQFMLALRGRLSIFLACFGATLVAAVLVTLLLPKTYESTVSLLVDIRDEQSLSGTAPSARNQIGYMQTQIDIIQSQRVARMVAQELKIADNPQARDAFAKSGAPGDINDWIGSGLLAKLRVESTQSSVINLTYSAPDPQFATRAANAFAKAYMDTTLNLRVEPTRLAATWFDEQMKSLRKDLEAAQGRLNAYQREKGILANDEKADIESARLAELSNQALQAQNLTFESASRSGLANRNAAPDSLPEVLGNPLVQSLKTQMLVAESKLQELSTRLGPNHPQYQQQASEIAALRARMNGEVARVVAGVKNVTVQAQAREASLRQALEEQRRRVVELRDARREATVLLRDVETAQKAYEAAQQRYLVNKVESGARLSNVTILNPATEPTLPSKPRVYLNIMLGLAMGLALGLGMVFLLEILDRRVRSSDDLENGMDAPLLGSLQPWHPSRLLGGPGSGGKALPSPA